MKAYAHTAPGRLEWIDIPEPVLCHPYGAILKPIAVSPCTSDIHTIAGNKGPKLPNLVMGHECVAQIISVAEKVHDFKEGDIVIVPAITPDWRAVSIQDGNYNHAQDHFSGHKLGRTVNGVFSEMFAIDDADTTLCHLPPELSLEQGLMCADVMTTGFTAAENANIKTGDLTCVIGIGAVGLMAVAAASHLGSARIIAIGSRKKSVELAFRFGASEVVDYHNNNISQTVLKMTENIGPDNVIIAGGGDEVFSQAVDMVRYGIGTISNVNYYGGEGGLIYPKFSGGRGMAGKTIHMELAKGGRARIERMVEMIRYNRVDPSPLVTDVLHGWNNLEKAFSLMKNKDNETIKIMLKVE